VNFRARRAPPLRALTDRSDDPYSRSSTEPQPLAPTLRLPGAITEAPNVSIAIEPESASESRLGRSVSIDQAASLLNVSRRTVYNRIRDGRLQTIRTLGGSQRVLVESLYELGFRPQAFSTSASAATFAVRPGRN